ncbi:hypothetical protein BV898_12058 [Hypsibius exemplaris]|uniref:Uncharacterized protein n=1 Tax=Hypsibius exemplaris TaxID=2072580 RepID=A0A1W0WF35_HYPEX|nr:hypothetical protein BV898_12058 [Hypsibius exemplaris]
MLGCGTASSLLRINPDRPTIENVLLRQDEIKSQRNGSPRRRRSLQQAHCSRSPSPQPPLASTLATLAEYYFEPPLVPSRNGSRSMSICSFSRYVRVYTHVL